jgi:hypothetical protein
LEGSIVLITTSTSLLTTTRSSGAALVHVIGLILQKRLVRFGIVDIGLRSSRRLNRRRNGMLLMRRGRRRLSLGSCAASEVEILRLFLRNMRAVGHQLMRLNLLVDLLNRIMILWRRLLVILVLWVEGLNRLLLIMNRLLMRLTVRSLGVLRMIIRLIIVVRIRVPIA